MKVKNIILDIVSTGINYTFPSGEIADEKSIINNLGNHIYEHLKEHEDINTILISDITIQEKIRITNKLKAFETIFVSLHCDNGVGDGFDLYTIKGDTRADVLAESIINSVTGIYDNISVNLKYDYTSDTNNKAVPLYTLRHTTCPAVNIGCGYLFNYSNFKQLENPDLQKNISDNLYRGIKDYVEQTKE